jgi:choline monooxygenase
MDFLPLDSFTFDATRSRDYDVAANWALYCENYLEGFHIPFVHPELNKALDWRAYEVELEGSSVLQIGIAAEGATVFDLPEDHPDSGKRIAAYYWWLFPNLMLNFYPWGLSANIVEPTGPQSCRVRFLSYVWRKDMLNEGAGGPLDAVEMEDEAVVEAVQSGVNARLYGRGRYSPTQEKGTHHFHLLLVDALFGD